MTDAQKIKELADDMDLTFEEDRHVKKRTKLHTAIDALQVERDELYARINTPSETLYNGRDAAHWNAVAVMRYQEICELEAERDALAARAKDGYMDGYECAKNEARDAYDALRQQLEAAQAEAADGYAARMAEARRYGAMAVALEAAQSRIDFKEMVIERNAELARLAELTKQERIGVVSETWARWPDKGNVVVVDWVKDTPPIGASIYAAAGASPAQPSQALSLDLLERLSKTLTRLGYATPEGGMEHFNADLTNQLYNLCRAVDSLFDREQPPAPSDAAREYMTGYSDEREWAAAPQPKETK